MTNKLPVVGKRYKVGVEVEIKAIFDLDSEPQVVFRINEREKRFLFFDFATLIQDDLFMCDVKSLIVYFEELPEDKAETTGAKNAQAEEVVDNKIEPNENGNFKDVDNAEEISQDIMKESIFRPVTDIKEERIEPVSIWKDVRRVILNCDFSSDQIWLYKIFINFFEQMQKDIEELKKK